MPAGGSSPTNDRGGRGQTNSPSIWSSQELWFFRIASFVAAVAVLSMLYQPLSWILVIGKHIWWCYAAFLFYQVFRA